MNKRIPIIVVGAGRGQSHLRALLSKSDYFEVVGLVDMDQERLKKVCLANKIPEKSAYTSFKTALAESDCEAVVIATWARTHDTLVREAILAGKHVLVEKPFTLEITTAKDLLLLAEKNNVRIVVTQQWRYLRGQRTMKRLIAEQFVGKPQVGHMVSYKSRNGEYPDSSHSQLWQMTVHEIDSLTSIMGEPVTSVSGHSFRPPESSWKRESTATAELTLKSGCRIVLLSTSDARINALELRIECTEGALRYQNSASFSGDEKIDYVTKDSKKWKTIELDSGPTQVSELDEEVALSFASWINDNKEPETSGKNNLEILAVLDALLQSGKSSCQVTISEAN